MSFPENRIGPDEPRERGWSLISPGASHVSRRAARQNSHSPAPQCTAGRVTRSGGFWLDRYGSAPHSARSSLLRVVRTPGWQLPSLATASDSRRRDHRPTYPGRELSSWRGGGSGESSESRSFGGVGLRGLRPRRLEGSLGRANGGCPSADLP